MILQHLWGLFARPEDEWQAIHDDRCSIGQCFISHVLILAAIPPVCSFIGTTQVGWTIGAGDPVKLTVGSALGIAVLVYITFIVAVLTIGKLIHWMGQTYGATQNLAQSVALAAYTATPLFLLGVMQLYPILWLNFIVGLPALAYTVYLFYTGVPIMMEIPKERGFLFSSAVLAVGLVMLVGVLAATVILWQMGLGPAFTR